MLKARRWTTMSRSGSKRKSSETDTDDYEPGNTADNSGSRAAEAPRKQQSSPYIGVTKVSHFTSSYFTSSLSSPAC